MLPAAKQFLGIKIEKYESQIQKGKEVVTSKSPQIKHIALLKILESTGNVKTQIL